MPTRPPIHRPAGAAPPGEARAQWDRHRAPPRKRGYDRDWEQLRRAFLAANPLCLFHQQKGQLVVANQVDHKLTIEERPDLRLVWSNLRSLCHSCHSARTARDQARK